MLLVNPKKNQFFIFLLLLGGCGSTKEYPNNMISELEQKTNIDIRLRSNKLGLSVKDCKESHEELEAILFSPLPESDKNFTESRKVISRDVMCLMKELKNHRFRGEGQIDIKTCIDRMGNVVYTELMKNEGVSYTPEASNALMQCIMNYKFEVKLDDPCLRCGKMSINTDLSNINR